MSKESLLAVHSRALTAHDLDTMVGHAARDVRCTCDGRAVGEGHAAMRELLEREYHGHAELVGRVFDMDGDTVLAEFSGHDKPTPRGILRITADGDRVRELSIDHDDAVLQRLVGAGTRVR